MTLGAALCGDEVADGVCADGGAFMHGPTFMANPLACAVEHADVRLLLDGPWEGSVRALEQRLREGLAPARALPGVAHVRVLGGIGGIELAEEPDPARLQTALVERGAWVRPFGRLVYARPPYISSSHDVAVISRAMVGAVEEVASRERR